MKKSDGSVVEEDLPHCGPQHPLSWTHGRRVEKVLKVQEAEALCCTALSSQYVVIYYKKEKSFV